MQTLEETDSSLKNAENEVSGGEAKREKNSLWLTDLSRGTYFRHVEK